MVDYEVLIQRLTDEVLKRLKVSQSPQKTLYLWPNKQAEVKEANLLGEELKALSSDYKIVDRLEDSDEILMTDLPNDLLFKLAKGDFSAPEPSEILESLMKGKIVWLLDRAIHFKRYQNTCPKPLWDQMKAYENILLSYGVRSIQEVHLFHKQCMERDLKNIDESFLDLTKEYLITEKKVEKALEMKHDGIRVDTKAQITPLAKDKLRQEHLQIKRINSKY